MLRSWLAAAPASLRRLAVLCLAILLWAFGFGLLAPLASLWLHDGGYSDKVVGLSTSVYYAGIALAAPLVPRAMRRWGKGSIVLGMVASAVTTLGFPWGGSLAGWFVLRLLNGVAGALSLIPVETLVNHNSPPEHRSRDFGFYAVSVAVGMALGTLVGTSLYAAVSHEMAFVVGGLVSATGAWVIGRHVVWPSMAEEEAHVRTPVHFGRNFLSFGSAWSQGFLEGAMVSLLPVFLVEVGLTEAQTGYLMSATMVGVIAAQVPVAWLADRLGRTAVLLGCTVVTAGMLAVLTAGPGLGSLAMCLFLAGACSSAFYPLGLALLGERLPAAGIARGSAWFLAINCIGSLIGPVAAGVSMDQFGRHALFAAGLAAVLGVVLAWAFLSLRRRHAILLAVTRAPVADRPAA